MFDFNVLRLFGINTRSGKVLSPFSVRWEFPSPGWVKINTNGATMGFLVFLVVLVFFMGVWGSLLVVSLFFFVFRLFWLLSFMELYMLLNKLKRWVLLVYGLNVILPWFVLHLLLGLTFLRWFVNTCLNYCGKIKFRVSHIFREGNACADKFANLGFIHKEYFH